MALTYINGKRSYNSVSSTTVTTNETDGGTLNVAIGDLLMIWLKHEGAATTITSIADTAGNTWHQGTWRHHANGDLHGIFMWAQATVANAADVVTVTLAAARSSKRLVVTQFRPTTGKVATQAAEYTNEGTTGSPGSGAGTITWTTTEGVVVASYSPYNPTEPTSATINGVAATLFPGPVGAPYAQVWYRMVTAGFTGGSASTGMSDVWVSNLIAISFDAAATPLTIANTAQAQTVDAPVLGVGLTVANTAQAQATDAPTLTAHSGTAALSVANTAQAQTSDNVGLTQHSALTVAALAQAQTVGALVLTVNLVIDNTDQAQTSANLNVSGSAVALVIDAVWHGVSADAPTLTYHPGLNIASTAQAQTAGNVGLTQHQVLGIAALSQAQTVDDVGLTQHGALTVASGNQAQTSDNVGLTQHGALTVASGNQAQTVDNVGLTQHAALTVAALAQAQTVGNVGLTVGLVIANSAQAQTSDAPVLHLGGSALLAIAASVQAQTPDGITVGVGLTIANVMQTQATDRMASNPWQAHCAVVANTPTIALGLLRHLNAFAAIPSLTGGAALAVKHNLTGLAVAYSVTPLTVWLVQVHWQSHSTVVSVTATAQFEGLHPFTAFIGLTVVTPDTVDLPVARTVTATVALHTVTPLVSLWVTGLTGPRGAVRIRFRTR